MPDTLPEKIESVPQLEDLLSEPTDVVCASVARAAGDVLILGAGGKMGLSLARMLRRAADLQGDSRRIMAVSRFSRAGQADLFQQHGIETCAGDLLDPRVLDALPTTPNVIFMTGMKFGTGGQAAQTWAMNVYLPSLVCRRFTGSRFVAFSTGNVYPFVPAHSGGSVETDRLDPIGEYGMSALGRERMFEYFSLLNQIPVTIVRLNYAVEMRYGVLLDLARRVYEQQPIDLTMGYVNVIWQGDANAYALCGLADAATPPAVINVAGPELVDVRQLCDEFANRFGRTATYVNAPAENALLNNATATHTRYGPPRVSLDQLIDWTVHWVERDGASWNKPTHFQTRNGQY